MVFIGTLYEVKIMISTDVYPMTIEGKEQLEAELQELKTIKTQKVADRINTASSFCHFAEDSEYHLALDERDSIKNRICIIEQILQNKQIIDSSEVNIDEVSLGNTVTFKELADDTEEKYTIVGKVDADPFLGKISNESPVAQALLGKSVNDIVEIETPSGEFTVKITKIA